MAQALRAHAELRGTPRRGGCTKIYRICVMPRADLYAGYL